MTREDAHRLLDAARDGFDAPAADIAEALVATGDMPAPTSVEAKYRPMIDCSACAVARHRPHTGLYRSGCLDCDARAIASSPAAWKAAHAITTVELTDAIERVFGTDGFANGSQLVSAWMRRLGVCEGA